MSVIKCVTIQCDLCGHVDSCRSPYDESPEECDSGDHRLAYGMVHLWPSERGETVMWQLCRQCSTLLADVISKASPQKEA